ncbi:PSD1 and planctomycete cytochrome C domain-containing protein [Aurantibacter sp.]|uniref:PSD1 and planctomycete cytochrome C domain-containing protein n=1 Tax=Aurantibacter sp. TaxID=2807103 RepID=UPI003267DF55
MIFFKRLAVLFCFSFICSCGLDKPEEVAQAYAKLPDEIDFNFHVRPILSDRCFNCHGPDENARKANLRLDTEDAIFKNIPGKETFPVVEGKPEKSELISRILSQDSDLIMPTPESNLILTAEEKAILIKWIEQGAKWKTHWAYSVPEKSELPEINNTSWPKNEIDFFVLNKLESNGLNPSEEANKETLIRRLSFDLNGLPPTPEEIQTFQNDNSNNAYEKLVDRLLESPRYGERWAWEWLDVARYADTNGFQGDFTRDMWPWRDWVIRAFNDNMPYDKFTVKQLAGDLLPNASREDIMATAFNRNHPYNTEGGTIPEETRVVNVFDRVETTGTTWLGLTMNCARCHDHKYDAITQKEYYQLYDYFNQTSEEGGNWGGQIKPVLNLSPKERRDKMAAIQENADKLIAYVHDYENKKFPRDNGLPVSESKVAKTLNGLDPRILLKPPNKRGAGNLKTLANYFINKDNTYAGLLKNAYKEQEKHNKLAATSTMVMVMDEREEPRTTYILNRGGYNNPQLEDTIVRNVPAVLPPLPKNIENNRLALAKWLVSKEQPLTARVTVNRYWQQFFGNGIVKTIEDFGVQGALPSHPKLLDWLAVDFQENDWDLKRLLKKIVMSATYRQSSKVSEELLQKDTENKYLARATRMRLPSWMLRDQALYISGLMADSLGGKPVKPYQPEGIWAEATFGLRSYEQDKGNALYRRSLYTFWRRIVGPTFLFDNASRQLCSVKSFNTNTPLHALTTLNDITYSEAARVMAENILSFENNDSERLKYAFKKTTGRLIKQEEFKILNDRLLSLKNDYAKNKKEALALTTIGEYKSNKQMNLVDHAAYTAICSLLLNLDETINRQ